MAGGPAGDEGGLAPGGADAEIECAGHLRGALTVVRERAVLMDEVSVEGERVEEGTAGDVSEFAHEVLIDFIGGHGVATDGGLDAAVEREGVPAEADRGINAKIERVVSRAAIDDGVGGGHGDGAAGVADLVETAEGGQGIEVQVVSGGHLGLEG